MHQVGLILLDHDLTAEYSLHWDTRFEQYLRVICVVDLTYGRVSLDVDHGTTLEKKPHK